MSDFAQNGLITTLQRLNDTHLENLEADLSAIVRHRPIALVLPCHAGELDRPALGHIVSELRDARWLHEIVVSMNGPDPAAHARAEAVFATLPQRVRVLWNEDRADPNTPRGAATATGKGENVAAAFRLLCAEEEAAVLITQDCDVASFRRQDLARLAYAVAHPDLGFQFAKAYYSRATDRLYGRVTRLFLTPLLHACVRVAGHHPLLSFLLSFRYPLAGEVALTRELATTLPIAPGWSLELAMLCDVFRQVEPRAVCQVDGGRAYEHKHQPAASALREMATEIGVELLRQLTREAPLPADFRAMLGQAYRREAAQAIRRSAALAQINALPFDVATERETVEGFAAQFDA
jgi:glucosyl-3-phosphoglycerate synthase